MWSTHTSGTVSLERQAGRAATLEGPQFHKNREVLASSFHRRGKHLKLGLLCISTFLLVPSQAEA